MNLPFHIEDHHKGHEFVFLLTVIQTQGLQLGSESEAKPAKAPNPELYVKAQLGPQLFKTSRTAIGSTSSSSGNPSWNEDLVFVVAEPFEPFLFLTVEYVTNGQSVGHAKVHVPSIEKRSDDWAAPKSSLVTRRVLTWEEYICEFV
ncbi:hypothetical protein ACFX10_013723 [Malus domestica]